MIIILTLIVFIVFIVKSTCNRGPKSPIPRSSLVERTSLPSLPTDILVMTAPTESLSTSKDVEGATSKPTEYKVYPMRWFVLMTVNLLALSNATMWMTYTSATRATARFYCNQTNEGPNCQISKWTTQIFQLMGTILGIMGMYVTDQYGIKVSTRAGCLLNLVGALIRIVSSLPSIPLKHRTGILHSGTVIVSSAQPFFLVLSPKVAEYWFPEDQRALSNVLSFIANPLGVALGTIIPVFILNQETIDLESMQFLVLNIILTSVPVIAFIMSMMIKSSAPPTPPSASSDNHENAPNFCKALGMIFTNKHFYIILIVFGGAFGQLWAVYTASDELLSLLGYSPSVTGYTVVVACAFGVGVSLLFGAYVDKTKKFKEVIRVCMVGFFITACGFNFMTRFKSVGWWSLPLIFLLNAFLGMSSIPVFPIGIEIGIEATFPVQEATSSGLLVIVGQLELFIVIAVMDWARDSDLMDFMEIYKTGVGKDVTPSNYSFANDIWCVISLVSALVALFLLNPPYKRVAFENEHKNKAQTDKSTSHNGSPSIKNPSTRGLPEVE